MLPKLDDMVGQRLSKLQSRQLLCKLLAEDFADGEGDDDFVAALEKRFDIAQTSCDDIHCQSAKWLGDC